MDEPMDIHKFLIISHKATNENIAYTTHACCNRDSNTELLE